MAQELLMASPPYAAQRWGYHPTVVPALRHSIALLYEVQEGGCCLPCAAIFPWCCCADEIRARRYARVMENREESNAPRVRLSCSHCVEDGVRATHFDRSPYDTGFRDCPGHFYPLRVYWCLCFNTSCGIPCGWATDLCVTPCVGDALMFAPCDNWLAKLFCSCPHRAWLQPGTAPEYAAKLTAAVTAFRESQGYYPEGSTIHLDANLTAAFEQQQRAAGGAPPTQQALRAEAKAEANAVSAAEANAVYPGSASVE